MEFNATLLVSAVSFIIFVIIMNQILYKPVLAIMQKRQEYINNNRLAADEHGKHANALLEEKDKKIGEAHRKSRDIVAAKTEAIKNEKSKERYARGAKKRPLQRKKQCLFRLPR